MPTFTPNYNFNLPLVNDPVDEDLWGFELNDNWSELDTLLKAVSDATKLPVGSLYVNATVNTNPSVLLGYGTWIALGAGRVLIGVGTGTDTEGEMRTFNGTDTGGAYSHELTADENGPHTHVVPCVAGAASGVNTRAPSNTATDTTVNTLSSGLGDPHNNVQPYLAVWMWVRTV